MMVRYLQDHARTSVSVELAKKWLDVTDVVGHVMRSHYVATWDLVGNPGPEALVGLDP